MVFKKMLGAFGVGGPSVDTVLSNPNTRPGLVLEGQVNLRGGGRRQHRADHPRPGHPGRGGGRRQRVRRHRGVPPACRSAGALRLAPKQQLSIPFQLPVPWETPITDVYGQRLHGMTMGLRTELAVARAVDKGDLDPVTCTRCRCRSASSRPSPSSASSSRAPTWSAGTSPACSRRCRSTRRSSSSPPRSTRTPINEVELTFVTNPHGVDVVIEFDKRGGLFAGGHDSFGRYRVDHADADQVDWVAQVDTWLRQALDGHQSRHAGHGYGQVGYGPRARWLPAARPRPRRVRPRRPSRGAPRAARPRHGCRRGRCGRRRGARLRRGHGRRRGLRLLR